MHEQFVKIIYIFQDDVKECPNVRCINYINSFGAVLVNQAKAKCWTVLIIILLFIVWVRPAFLTKNDLYIWFSRISIHRPKDMNFYRQLAFFIRQIFTPLPMKLKINYFFVNHFSCFSILMMVSSSEL